MSYSLDKIAGIIHAQVVGAVTTFPIEHLLIDSRKIIYAPASLFFAIRGERHNGHSYIAGLYEKGVRSFVISDPFDNTPYPEAVFLQVENVLLALQQVAKYHREQFNIPVIGITGSNGKTIIKEWLYQLLREDKNIVRSPKSYNSQVGVPLSVWQLNQHHQLGIFEAGISLPGEMEKLAPVIQPAIGIITNIGQPHSENFETLKQKAEEKLKLFKNAHTLIYCADHLILNELISGLNNVKLFSWSFIPTSNANLCVQSLQKEGNRALITGVFKEETFTLAIPFRDDASIENALHCVACLCYLGYSMEEIRHRIAELTPVAMRLELKEGVNTCSVINDSYNSDLGSLSIALDFLNQQQQYAKRTVILSDILQSGIPEEQLYKEVATLLHTKQINRLIGIGEAISRQGKQFQLEKYFFPTTQQFLSAYHPGQFHQETILLKGARSFGFEAISNVLQQKAHETVLEINLNALVHNLNYFRSRLKPGTKIMAMVKAFSYGSGSFEIANVLQYHRVDYLAVAYADEGVELRKAGITLPIMVMNPEEQSYDAMLQYGLEPELFNLRVWDRFAEVSRTRNDKTPIAVHLKLDTGMHRLGFEPQDIEALKKRIGSTPHLRIISVFSHLAASDEPLHDAFTREQLTRFRRMADELSACCGYPVLHHIANSAAITRFPEAQMDMVRLGIGLYGIGAEEQQSHLQEVSTLKTTISQIKHIPSGESVGYNRNAMIVRPTTIATVPIGYADGLSRKLSNGNGSMLVNGREALIIGNVCMDMCMLDITGIVAAEGDEVIVFGGGQSIEKIAKAMGTIPYEVLTNVSRRVKRVYFQE